MDDIVRFTKTTPICPKCKIGTQRQELWQPNPMEYNSAILKDFEYKSYKCLLCKHKYSTIGNEQRGYTYHEITCENE